MPVPDFIRRLRAHVGTAELWLPGITAVVLRGEDLLLVLRADDGEWAPVGGIVEPGEEPAAAAVREAIEETGVRIRVDRLAGVDATAPIVHPNGDVATYLNHTFLCTWLEGEPYVADDECTDVGWFPRDGLPPLSPSVQARVDDALCGEAAARFRL